MKIYLTSFLGTFLYSSYIYFIGKNFFIGIFIAAFTVNFIASLNIDQISKGNIFTKIGYSVGGSLGAICGVLISSKLIGT